jgi:hydroxyethylthiazole kinase-like sugar kinase family protein
MSRLTTMLVLDLLDRFQMAVIKGNAAEIGALVGSTDVRQEVS